MRERFNQPRTAQRPTGTEFSAITHPIYPTPITLSLLVTVVLGGLLGNERE
ncbi:MAG: hypothetical protein OEM52_04785 [bacterium]|nr:hypothetical protein [bacterium]